MQLSMSELGASHGAGPRQPIDNFRLVFHDQFISSVVRRMDDNADIYGRVLDDPAFQAAFMEHYLTRVFAAARKSP